MATYEVIFRFTQMKMAPLLDDSKIVVPLLPSLRHMASVQVAVAFYRYFSYATLEEVFKDVECGNSSKSDKGSECDPKTLEVERPDEQIQCGSSKAFGERSEGYAIFNKAKDTLRPLPVTLQSEVLNAALNMHPLAFQYEADYLKVFSLKNEDITLQWSSNGTVDAVKTAQEIVLNKNIDIRKRFQLACVYCFEKNIQSMWAEMVASGNIKTFPHPPIVAFWIQWMQGGREIEWVDALLENFNLIVCMSSWKLLPRFSSFFPRLQPEDRQRLTMYFGLANPDDLMFCLYAVTKEEEEQILSIYAHRLMDIYLQWPLRSLSLETAEKLWSYVDKYD